MKIPDLLKLAIFLVATGTTRAEIALIPIDDRYGAGSSIIQVDLDSGSYGPYIFLKDSTGQFSFTPGAIETAPNGKLYLLASAKDNNSSSPEIPVVIEIDLNKGSFVVFLSGGLLATYNALFEAFSSESDLAIDANNNLYITQPGGIIKVDYQTRNQSYLSRFQELAYPYSPAITGSSIYVLNDGNENVSDADQLIAVNLNNGAQNVIWEDSVNPKDNAFPYLHMESASAGKLLLINDGLVAQMDISSNQSTSLAADSTILGLNRFRNDGFEALENGSQYFIGGDFDSFSILKRSSNGSVKVLSVISGNARGIEIVNNTSGFQQFMSEQGISGNQAGFSADYNADGIKNGLAYAFEVEAKEAVAASDLQKLPKIVVVETGPKLEFIIPQNRPDDVRYIIETSSGLNSNDHQWNAIAILSPENPDWDILKNGVSVSNIANDNQILTQVNTGTHLKDGQPEFIRVRVHQILGN